MRRDADLFEKACQCAVIETRECGSHKAAMASKTFHKRFVGQCVGEIASTPSGRFEFGPGTGELFEYEDTFALSCSGDSRHHACRAGIYDDKVVLHYLSSSVFIQ